MAAFIGESRRKFCYVFCYGMVSTMPVKRWFFIETAEWTWEKCSLVVFGGWREVSPYVKGRERVVDGHGGRHGGVGAGVLPT